MSDIHSSLRLFGELAAALAYQAETAITRRDPMPIGSLPRYWVSSQSRIDSWNQFLHHINAGDAEHWMARQASDSRMLDWIEEILLSEMVTRVWAAVTLAHDRHHGVDESSPVARRVWFNHLDVRRRLLRALLEGLHIDPAASVCIDQTRRRAERWTDLLLGYVMPVQDVSEYAFSAERARDFWEGLCHERQQHHGHYTWPLVLSSLRSTFSHYGVAQLPNQRLHEEIHDSILAAFGADQLECTGLFHAIWQMRMTHVADNAEILLAEALDD